MARAYPTAGRGAAIMPSPATVAAPRPASRRQRDDDDGSATYRDPDDGGFAR
ncbi:hypothetical protein J2S43_000914 [Catenuloplanes nepalensis]|uniref:Uncharacterized protein n=1 Tax=Catenuloplanes nepalensis TaxID=587533 RepID=A0ABT9MLV3_9ACTN|nr:hypothetical protein [Catenuloplanes nepalensis]MDP9792402.1 hypothetical protein [Catenuloplanes nepalensis]